MHSCVNTFLLWKLRALFTVFVRVYCQEGFDEAFLKDALLERLKDDVPDVVLSALSALRVGELLKSYDHQESMLSNTYNGCYFIVGKVHQLFK